MNKKGFIFSFFLFIFSFCFIGNVKALNVNYHGITVNDNMINNIWSQLEGKTSSQFPNTNLNDSVHVWHQADYPKISITKKRSNNNLLYITFIHDCNGGIDGNYLTGADLYGSIACTSYWNPDGNSYGGYSFLEVLYNISTNTVQSYNSPFSIFRNIWWQYSSKTMNKFEPSATSWDISFTAGGQNRTLNKSFDNTPSDSFLSINFHLNGGSVFDLYDLLDPITYTEDFTKYLDSNSINDYLNFITPYKNNYTFNGWYLDSNFTEPFDSESAINSSSNFSVDLYAKWDINKWTFNFHLDGGSIIDRTTNESNYSDFSITLYKDEIADFLSNSLFRHNYKGFESLYFDDSYLYKFTGTEDIGTLNSYSYSSNDEKYIDIYVKWYFLNVHDFLNHTNFTKYSFDTNYDYAVLSRGSNSSQMFLGLDFLVSNLPIYLYDSFNDEILFSDSDGLMDHCSLSPDYVYDQRYYYELEVNCFDSISSSSYEILILPKSFFERAGVIGSYDFYLTDNVHLTYTNDLSNMTIYDKNDNSFTTDIDNVAGYPDSSVNVNDDLTSNFKSSLDYFLNPIKFIVKTITDLFNKYLNSSLRSYFYLVFVLIIAFFIIRIFF